ncbi:biotin-dependent carboxyltransferase family protein [Dickeya chrysanthemi]|uniref:Biotin-dependent carboxyltransferase family protein n=1 Tax=Dickeya chrysanthemi TaxID=556 RepID=A0ABU8JL07_DICCH|nr:biotin-dependent carboxyltransferase family protein [Dickeya chrysanthemi]MBX9444907.1 biotin-dependent carboxyltransferase family protein [Dickeya chrysanthemi]MCA7007583.1 biotin-dependent carboxyltransferase family protein [Dickeya chrysanthemi]
MSEIKQIEIIQAGPLVTVQDLGRHGSRHQGVSRAGALDGLSLQLANRLVGNTDEAAGLEMLFGNTRIRFLQDVWFALAGCDCFATLKGKPVYPGWAKHAAAGDELIINMPRNGLCAYLALSGGIEVSILLGSRSTDVQGGFGGWQGRKLQTGDVLPIGKHAQKLKNRGVLLPVPGQEIRVLAGPEAEQFDAQTRKVFFSHGWEITADSNRMGFRLKGDILVRRESADLLSHGVFPGTIQVPPNGQPIILAAEAQATGGYPRIASVIQPDLWKLGQLRPGTRVHFTCVGKAEALQAKHQQQHYLERVAYALTTHK